MKKSALFLSFILAVGAVAADYYTEPALYHSRPDPAKERHFGEVGVTGLKLRIYPGVVLKVEETVPGSPADGKFAKDDVITGVNGVALRGLNPFTALGRALTEAEAKDGKLVFEVEGKAPVTVVIPVLGAYSPTWPRNCKKSEAIVRRAAEYYAQSLQKAIDFNDEGSGIPAALKCLFLLSTGDDAYLPVVKSYFDRLGKNIAGIGDHTWNNGYNGVACAEYYLRTGDTSVLPILQYYCDNARDRQFYGAGWGHWGRQISPQYVSGGLMNPAAAQVATTLVLAKECGVKVDDRTMLGALQFFYRFAGRGTVAYGDHRAEIGLASNGKDGMAAALMQVASNARGNTKIYRDARNWFALSMLESFPGLVTGHGDEGRGDAIWRSITSDYLREIKPAIYRTTMDELRWWYDLSRRSTGAFGAALAQYWDEEGTGAAVAMVYTAHLKTLRITGAPRSKYARDFTLPEHLWGRPADLKFIAVEPDSEEPTHVLAGKLSDAKITKPDYAEMTTEELVRATRHRHFNIRTQAAKALMHKGAFRELERLMTDPDPRVRRAACDGLTDYRYWFAVGKKPIATENVTPAMVAAIRKMLSDPNEAIFTVDGALLALTRAKPEAAAECVPDILPWLKSDEWWVRQSAFWALATAAKADGVAPKVLPALTEALVREDRPTARDLMTYTMNNLAKTLKPADACLAALQRAVAETEIKPGVRAGEGGFYVQAAALASLEATPGSAVETARSFAKRLQQVETRHIAKVTEALMEAREKLPDAARDELTAALYGDFRRELLRRMNAGDAALDTIVALTRFRHPEVGWQELGRPPAAERVWQFTSFEPGEKDFLHPREQRRFRDVALPAGMENWFAPDFDATKWTSGRAPIGKGLFKPRHGKGEVLENRSAWGEGEFLLARTTFEMDAVDCDFYRLGVLANSGFRIYLNGHPIHTYIWWNNTPEYRKIGLGSDGVKHLKKGVNTLAVYANAVYEGGAQVGQFDIRLEGLKKSDLMKDE